MTQTEQETEDQANKDRVRVRRPTVAEERMTPPTDTTASDNWKLENESFRRMLRTGEFAQAEEDPEQAQAAEQKPAA